MNYIENKDLLKQIKRKICVSISLFLMKIYENFRGCSGVKEQTEKRFEEYNNNENKVKIIEKNLPRIYDETEKIKARNAYLEGRVIATHQELKLIKRYCLLGEIDSILSILKKYNFNDEIQ